MLGNVPWQGGFVFICIQVLGYFVMLIATGTAEGTGLLVEKEGNSGRPKRRLVVLSDYMESWVQDWKHPTGAALWPRDTESIPLPWEWIGSVPLFYYQYPTEVGPDFCLERERRGC